MKLIGILAHKTTTASITLVTAPPLTEEVVREASSQIGSKALMKLSCDEGRLVVKGPIFPPRPEVFTRVAEILNEAEAEVEKRKKAAKAEHDGLLKAYADISGLPILE